MIDLNALAAEIHVENKKWWVDLYTGEPIERNKGEVLMLIVSEIAEAMEAERKNLMDSHLPHRRGAEVELADAVIRLLDMNAGYGFGEFESNLYLPKASVCENKAEYLYELVKAITRIDSPNAIREIWKIESVIDLINAYCNKYGYDLWGAVEEKRAYNQTREDHKAENRIKDGGKKF